MSDKTERLEGLLKDLLDSSKNYIDNKIAPDRVKAYEYYYGMLPAPRRNAPSIVKKVVFEKVQGALPQIKEPFITGRDVIRFMPFSSQDGEGARIASIVVNKILKTENNIDKIYDSLILDGLLAKSGTIKVYWEEKEEVQEESFERLSEQAYNMLINEDDVELVTVEENELEFNPMPVLEMLSPEEMALMVEQYPDPTDLEAVSSDWEELMQAVPYARDTIKEILDMNKTYSGSINRTTDVSTVKIKNVAPEDFLIDESSIDVCSSNFVAERSRVTISDLIEMQFKSELIDEVKDRGSDYADDSVLASRNSFDNTDDLNESDYIDLYECYVETALVDYDSEKAKGKRSKLYQMYYANGVLLEYNEVDKKPFFVWSPLPVANKMFGQSLAETLFEEQDSGTYALRGALQYLAFSTNPRYKAIQGTEYNLAAFQANLPGSVVPIMKGDLIPMEYPRLDQSLFQMLGTLGQAADSVSGVSDLSMGLNNDALRSNVAGSTVQNQMDASTRRIKNYARNLATQCIKPAFAYVYELYRKNSTVPLVVQVQGVDVEVDPKSLPQRRNVDVDYALGRIDQIEQGMALMNTKARIEQSAQLSSMQTSEQIYNLETDIMNSFGVYDSSRYISHPMGAPRPLSIMEQEQIALENQKQELDAQVIALEKAKAENSQLELQIKQQELHLKQKKLELESIKAENEIEVARGKFELEQSIAADKQNNADEELMFKQQVAADKQKLAEEELEVKILKTTAEIEIEADQQRAVRID